MQPDSRRRVQRSTIRLVAAMTSGLLGLAALHQTVLADSPYSTISPASPQADDIHGIYKLTFWLALIVFVGVQAALIYTVLRYRRRDENEERPEQTHGNPKLEVIWTIIPAIILLVIFVPTVRTIYAQADEIENPDMVVEVYGKQWWWEIHYKEPENLDGVVTGNEIRLPQGKRVLFRFYTNNVIHSFWVPQLSGKMDLIPGHENEMAIDTENVGYFFGQCAEFCGDSHALMRFKVIIEPEEQFNQYIDDWRAGPSEASAEYVQDGDISQVPQAFGVCLACHQVEGTNATVASEGIEQDPGTLDAPGAARTAGPNLSLFGCRTTLAAGTLTNTPENLAKWLQDPASIKPGNYMATVIQEGTLSEEQVQELVGYLGSLVPEGGCGEIPLQPGIDERVEVTDPE